MKTLFNSGRISFMRTLRAMSVTLCLLGFHSLLMANPAISSHSFEISGFAPWNICWDEMEVKQETVVALACLPNVNVSLNQNGFAVLTSIELVAGPEYLPFQYDVDIMGPLNDTVFCAQLGQYIMVVVTDPTGNSCMSTVHVEDKLRPVLTCTPDILPCNVDIATINFEDYLDVVTDNCDPDPDVYYSYVIQNLGCNPHGYTQQILVTWTATDQSGNSATCQDIIYLRKPSLGQIVFPPDITISCVNANTDPSNTGEPTFNGEPLGFACQIIVFHTDQVVPMCNGSQKILRLWTVMDWCNSGQVTDVQEILIIDNVPPVITCPANITLNTDMGVCTTKYTLPLPVVTDQCSNSAMIDIRITVGGIPGIFAPGAMVNLGLGTTVVTIRATDACGNSSTCHYNVTVKDQIPPIPICHSITVTLGPDGMAFLIAANLDFIVVENCGILSKQIFKMVNTCNTPEDLVPGPDVKFCCADVGQTIMVGFKVTDLSGNMNTCMFQVTVVDNTPPVAECKDITLSVNSQGSVVILPGQINDGSTDNCTITNITVTPNTFDCEDVGVNVVVLTVTDQSGNTATCTATVTITDLIPPVAVCQNVTITLDNNGNATITADLIDNGSSDNCAIDTIYLNEYDFDCDDEDQVNIVTLTVTDFGGNTSTCTATVTVLSNPPVAICHNITVSLDALGTVTITADTVDNGSTDDCGIDTITVTPNTFDCSDIGQNTVTLTVTDITGNTSTCTAIVTVEDDLPPIAICQDITIMLDASGMVTITAAQINNGSSDNCGDITISVTPFSFDCDDVGPNIVVLTVTDDSDNTSTCTATVTVLMPDPPIAICQDITVDIGPGGTVTIDPEDINNGSSTQCGDLTFTLDEDTFDCSELGPNVVTLTVTDETGVSSTCTATVTVNEGPPLAICQDFTVNLDANGNGTIEASDVDGGSTDDCGIEFYDVTPFEFDCDDIGENIVILTVTDSTGNTSTCTATVTVEDNLPPIAICQNITVSIGAGGTVIISGIDVDGGSSDNCDDDVSLSVTPNSFDCDDLGVQIVTLTVTDDAGNTSACTASVTITAEPPVAICQDITVDIGPGGTVTIDPEDINNGSSSLCGDLTFELDEDTFDCSETGPNVVTLTVTDETGASSTCTATVTVNEGPPLAICQDFTVNLDANGNGTIEASDVD
nr:HYR domain-containing protein [Bacteroidota bacterium]